MTLDEALALQPAWVTLWLNVLLFGAFILPLALLIWRQTRITALVTLATSVLAGITINMLYAQMGYVKLLGLPHILLWTPLAVYLYLQTTRPELSLWPRQIIWFILATITISLAFDYVDVLRYLLGDRTPMAGTP